MNIIVSRRSFLAGMAAFGAAARMRCVAGTTGGGRPALKFGVLSDIHITDWASTEVFRKALRYYRDAGVDAVLIAGDLADHGILPQLDNVARAWYGVFPDDRGADGAKVEKLFITGNHDYDGFKYRDRFMDRAFAVHGMSYKAAAPLRLTVVGLDRAWERCFHEPYTPIYRKRVKGYDFIGAHWTALNGLESWFKVNGGLLDPVRPFFYFQHPHPRDTVYGPSAWGHDAGQSVRALSPHPNAVAFSGHSHATLTDERSVWRGAFTLIGTASLSYVCLPETCGNSAALNEALREGLLVRQGQLVSVYDDRIEIERRDFSRDEPVDAGWTLELPARASSFAARAARAAVPAFAAEAAAAAAVPGGKSAAGVDVTFPPALANPAARPFFYEVRLEPPAAGGAAPRLIYSPTAALPKCHDADVKTIACAFPGRSLPRTGKYRFAIAPLDSYGVKGAAIHTPWISAPGQPA